MEALNARKRAIEKELRDLDRELRELTPTREALRIKLEPLRKRSASEKDHVARLRKDAQKEDQRTVRQGSAKYLVSQDDLDSGTLTLHWNRLMFSGWRGNVVIPLAEVSTIGSGRSRLARRAGIPLVARWFPGGEADGNTILLDLAAADGARTRAVIAALRDPAWCSVLKETRGRLPEAVSARSATFKAEQEAIERKAALDGEISAADTELRQTASRIGYVSEAISRRKRELSLPDWENETVQLKGRNLSQQLDRTLKSRARAGWELASTASPRKDEMVVTLRRVRPL